MGLLKLLNCLRLNKRLNQLVWTGRIRHCRPSEENSRLSQELGENLISRFDLNFRKTTQSNKMMNDHVFNFDAYQDRDFQNPQHELITQSTEHQYETANLKSMQHNGEVYVNSFDFLQRIQRWMYEHGLFNHFG